MRPTSFHCRIALAGIAFAALSCGGSGGDGKEASSGAALTAVARTSGFADACRNLPPVDSVPRTPDAILLQGAYNELRAQARGVAKVEYRACIDGDEKFSGTVTWYKDGVERQRFDVSGDHDGAVYSVDYYSERTHDSRGVRRVLCSEHLDRYFSLDDSAEDASFRAAISGAICLGSSALGDSEILDRYNLLNVLSISLDAFDHVDPKTFLGPVVGSTTRAVLGMQSTCYTLLVGRGGITEKCYGGDGLLLYSSYTRASQRSILEAAAVVEGVSDSDFALPAEVSDIGN